MWSQADLRTSKPFPVDTTKQSFLPESGCGLEISPSGRKMMVFTSHGKMLALNPDTATVEGGPFLSQKYGIRGLRFALGREVEDRVIVAPSSTWDYTIRLWEYAGNKFVREFKGHHGPILTMVYRFGDQVLSGSFDGTIRLFDVRADACQAYRRCNSSVVGCCGCDDGQAGPGGALLHLAQGSNTNSSLCICDIRRFDADPVAMVQLPCVLDDTACIRTTSDARIAVVWDSKNVMAVNAETGKVTAYVRTGLGDGVHSACLLDAGDKICVATHRTGLHVVQTDSSADQTSAADGADGMGSTETVCGIALPKLLPPTSSTSQIDVFAVAASSHLKTIATATNAGIQLWTPVQGFTSMQ